MVIHLWVPRLSERSIVGLKSVTLPRTVKRTIRHTLLRFSTTRFVGQAINEVLGPFSGHLSNTFADADGMPSFTNWFEGVYVAETWKYFR